MSPKFKHGPIPTQWLTFEQAAYELGTTLEIVTVMASLGLAPYYKLTYRTRIRPEDLEEWKTALVAFHRRTPPTRDPTLPSTGFVYYVQAEQGGPIKIGSTTNVAKRLIGLQNGSPLLLKLIGVEPGGRLRERELHIKLHYWRLHGEWFRETSLEVQRELKAARREWGYPRKNRLPKRLRTEKVCGERDRADEPVAELVEVAHG
jgi:hypothetical protein